MIETWHDIVEIEISSRIGVELVSDFNIKVYLRYKNTGFRGKVIWTSKKKPQIKNNIKPN